MPKIFISYRRADSSYVTDAIYSEMSKHFGDDVFLDVDDIPPGVDFPDFLAGQIADVDAVLVIIGQDWARIMEERADQENDFVRIEIESALEQGKLVIPVLVKNASMPNFSELPESIRDLQRKNAVSVDRHPNLRRDCERLAKGIERGLAHKTVGTTSTPSKTPRQQPVSTPAPKPPRRQSVSVPSSKPKFSLPDLHWINIPAGKVTLGAGGYVPKGQNKTFDVPAFAIAKYPVTNKQYAEYLKESGKEPHRRNDSDYNNPMQPVVGVSWHDAIAFCEWLSEKSGDHILLPTEQQWQRAAQGDDGRKYPWGNQWDASLANSYESGIDKTTPVTAYEGVGDSPYGVVDMSGNVWEWCLTAWRTGANDMSETDVPRVLRGGSFSGNSNDLRSANRYSLNPSGEGDSFGFRCVVSVPVP